MVLKKLKMELPYDPGILIQSVYLKKPKTLVLKNICPHTFIAVLFTIAGIWKQNECPSIDEWTEFWPRWRRR